MEIKRAVYKISFLLKNQKDREAVIKHAHSLFHGHCGKNIFIEDLTFEHIKSYLKPNKSNHFLRTLMLFGGFEQFRIWFQFNELSSEINEINIVLYQSDTYLPDFNKFKVKLPTLINLISTSFNPIVLTAGSGLVHEICFKKSSGRSNKYFEKNININVMKYYLAHYANNYDVVYFYKSEHDKTVIKESISN